MSDKKYIRKEAIALSYNQEKSNSPRVVAKGKGKIADNILEQATLHNVPIYEDRNLVELLGNLDLNESIPEELYQAVAEVFAFIYRLDRSYSTENSKK
ncbi:EscU/YscU/HrcU family type III secretion system export apparatus switch protein [Lysinibacillus endophyticus]|uniref:EscU/YscU/HrcU family type III secretion system export apparatus switch protein n=1 Tax=Ureibacillus endophyticus TaxID=1978490 RepID=UPI0020A1EEC3|nr:EscU/YscU/HrcU family type III secretion system export apparatus switch protein [Lysinibacillus endophyticus]MCP1144028.1 EscU/YscU/HrcU family type III secretion system export apparatus switch protein [Lysinibacillus endophyticus]